MPQNCNKREGTRFENRLKDMFYEHGFWVHLFQQNQAGQPCDLIAVKGEKAYIIDAKDCKSGRFPLSRVEENQFLSMTRWLDRTRHQAWFAFQLPDDEEVYFISFQTICSLLADDISSLNSEDIRRIGDPFLEVFF